MTKTKTKVPSTSGTSKLVRAKFAPGMLLQPDDLEYLNSYPRELSRLLFRSFFGCGVVCGLSVTGEDTCKKLLITIGGGLALDCNGDPVYLPKDAQLWVGEEGEEIPKMLWVVICGTTKCCAPRTAMCAADDDEPTSSCTREWDGYEIRALWERPDCVCGCPEPEDKDQQLETDCRCICPVTRCYQAHYDGECGCKCDDCPDCDCKCILLARLEKTDDKENPWRVDYRVRRFIRPVLMRDPKIEVRKKDKGALHGIPPEALVHPEAEIDQAEAIAEQAQTQSEQAPAAPEQAHAAPAPDKKTAKKKP